MSAASSKSRLGRGLGSLIAAAKPAAAPPPQIEGSVRLRGAPLGRPMGNMRLRRGHQALLPHGAAYRFRALNGVGVIVLQTIHGPHSVQRWAEICRR